MAHSSGAEGRLPLCQVLEEEYEQLHHPLPDDYPRTGSYEERLVAIYRLIHELPESEKRGSVPQLL